jgi:purine-nucleoside phosphorylase
MNRYGEIVQKAAGMVKKRIGREVGTAMILGSGLGAIAEALEAPLSIPYESIPGFPSNTIPGQSGDLLFGTLWGRDVLIFSGRFHLYQGYSVQ